MLPLSERLPIPPPKERTLTQHLIWLDIVSLERNVAMAEADLERRAGIPFNEFFYTQREARNAWRLFDMIRTMGTAERHRPFPGDAERKRDARRQREHIAAYQEQQVHADLSSQYQGEVE